MKRIQRLLVPTDLSDNSRRGLLYAYSLAAENQGVLTILHVANDLAAWEFYSDEFAFLAPTGRPWSATPWRGSSAPTSTPGGGWCLPC